ncbi:hypothetical protein C0J52_05416 [Blattella germanica]|nr:hypothetical protein C0J52_05416 [Blattella germanica]
MRNSRKGCNDNGGKSRRTQIRNCAICGDKAHSLHFGGLSCDSCKAFFRRSVQSGAFRGFSCSRLGGCILTITTRRSCQKCRFMKCVSVGMEPDWVLSEQKRHSQQNKQQLGSKKRKQLSEESSPLSQFLSTDEQSCMNNIATALQAAKRYVFSLFDTTTIEGTIGCDYITSEFSQQWYKAISGNVRALSKFCQIILQSVSPYLVLNKTLLPEICFLYISFTLGRDLLKRGPMNSDWVQDDRTTCDRLKCLSLNFQNETSEFQNGSLYEHSQSVCSNFCELNTSNDSCLDKCDSEAFEKMEEQGCQYYSSCDKMEQQRFCSVECQFMESERYSLLLQRYMTWKYGSSQALYVFAHSLVLLAAVKEISHHGITCSHNFNIFSMLNDIIPECWCIDDIEEQSSIIPHSDDGVMCISPYFETEICSSSHISKLGNSVRDINSCEFENQYLNGSSDCSNRRDYYCSQITGTSPYPLEPVTNDCEFIPPSYDCSYKIPFIENDRPYSNQKTETIYSNSENMNNLQFHVSSVIGDNNNQITQSMPSSDPVSCIKTQNVESNLHQTCNNYLYANCISTGTSNYDQQFIPETGNSLYPKTTLQQFEMSVNIADKSIHPLELCTENKQHYQDEELEENSHETCGKNSKLQNASQTKVQFGMFICDSNIDSRYYNSDEISKEQCILNQEKKGKQDTSNNESELYPNSESYCHDARNEINLYQDSNTEHHGREFNSCQLLDDMLKESSNQLSSSGDDGSFQKDIQTICLDWWLQDITCPNSNSSGYISSPSCQLSPQLSTAIAQS